MHAYTSVLSDSISSGSAGSVFIELIRGTARGIRRVDRFVLARNLLRTSGYAVSHYSNEHQRASQVSDGKRVPLLASRGNLLPFDRNPSPHRIAPCHHSQFPLLSRPRFRRRIFIRTGMVIRKERRWIPPRPPVQPATRPHPWAQRRVCSAACSVRCSNSSARDRHRPLPALRWAQVLRREPQQPRPPRSM